MNLYFNYMYARTCVLSLPNYTVTEWVAIIEAIIGTVTMLLIVAAILQLRLMKRQMNLEASLSLLKEYRHELWESRRFATSKLAEVVKSAIKKNPKSTYHNLDKRDQKHVENLSHFYDQVGLLVTNGLVDENIILSFFGGAALDTFRLLYPLIKNAREHFPKYQAFYEDLMCRLDSRMQIERIKTRTLSQEQKKRLKIHKKQIPK